jgi:chromosomal replication initiator protein
VPHTGRLVPTEGRPIQALLPRGLTSRPPRPGKSFEQSTPVDLLVDKSGNRGVEDLVNDTNDLWKRCADALREQVSDATWRTWLTGLVPQAFDGDLLVLTAPSTLVRDRIENRFLGLIAAAVSDVADQQVTVRLDVAEAAVVEPVPDELPPLSDGRLDDGPSVTGSPSRRRRWPDDASAGGLDARYGFDSFVIGSSNRFAHAAALSVAEMPARSYNPLFIHGGAGLGKTHLLHAIGNYVRDNFAGRHVRYVSTETFMNEFVDAIRNNTTAAFKRHYRECDVLLIDDVQFMEGKESLQEEFFHTFNHLYGASKQVVLTSDRPPKSIATLEDRLRSRFLSGLITDVQPPELETRLAILQKKSEREPLPVPDDVLEFIAANVKGNIRELEGALIRVCAFASLNHQPLSRDLAEHVLSDILLAGQPRRITPVMILEATASTFGFTVEDLCGPSRRRPLVIARQIGMYVFREMTDFSYPAIAREFGGRDHTTVMHAVDKISSLMKERRQIYDQVTELILRIKSGA